jgi:hypothetical protein
MIRIPSIKLHRLCRSLGICRIMKARRLQQARKVTVMEKQGMHTECL